MEKLVITVGSVTAASRLEKLLRRKAGVSSTVIHTPSAISGAGCSYSVVTDRKNLAAVREAAADGGINIRGFYIREALKGEYKYHAVS